MNWLGKTFGVDPEDSLTSVIPPIMAGIFVMAVAVITLFFEHTNLLFQYRYALFIYILIAVLFLFFFTRVHIWAENKGLFIWVSNLLASSGIGILLFFLPHPLEPLIYIMVLLAVLATSTIASRVQCYAIVIIFSIFSFTYHISTEQFMRESWMHISFNAVIIITIETIQQLKHISREQMRRIEIINEISGHIISTLDQKQLIELLNNALHTLIPTDTYYIGLLRGQEIHLVLFHDEGQFFNEQIISTEGTLSGWVIKNNKPLFVAPSSRHAFVKYESRTRIGLAKGSESWMGVPLNGTHITGLIAIASYKPNAFTKSDFQMFINIAERVAHVLDNIEQHRKTEQESRLDSLTRVYNHGYFIKRLEEQIKHIDSHQQPLSLIMLDIDYFKKYNDTYGHRVGDEVLVRMCEIIRSNIKQTDAIGRWGGEEFAILLPESNAKQSAEIAARIQQSLHDFKFTGEFHHIPPPTISMGIAIYPNEAQDPIKLIDLADKRLYIAKEHGRNQIQAAPAPKIK